jgi:spermidine synthase
MSARFEELDWRSTSMGELVLRRRRLPASDVDIFEVKLGDDFLMSSLFTVAEVAMARLALASLPADEVDVAVGGLGLGHTAHAVLEHASVRSLVVVEALAEVIEWHQRGLTPLGAALTSDPRCQFVHADFFALLDREAGLDPQQPGRRFDVILVDIDHSPRHLLHPRHASFYQPAGTRRLASLLRPGGVFALWSNDPPDAGYTTALGEVFPTVATESVRFHNPLQEREAANTVYLATTASGEALSR